MIMSVDAKNVFDKSHDSRIQKVRRVLSCYDEEHFYIYIYMANYMFRNIEVKGPHVELVLSFLHVSFAIKLSL